jgi:hypothetical protein
VTPLEKGEVGSSYRLRSACRLLPTDQNKGFRFSANLFQEAAYEAAFLCASYGACFDSAMSSYRKRFMSPFQRDKMK